MKSSDSSSWEDRDDDNTSALALRLRVGAEASQRSWRLCPGLYQTLAFIVRSAGDQLDNGWTLDFKQVDWIGFSALLIGFD